MELRPCTEQDRQAVLDGLLAYNHRYLKPAVDLSCCVEQEGRIAAGILARLLEDCIYVEILWVDESLRRQGMGRRLLAHVEEKGRALGAKRIELDTFSFQAPEYCPAGVSGVRPGGTLCRDLRQTLFCEGTGLKKAAHGRLFQGDTAE